MGTVTGDGATTAITTEMTMIAMTDGRIRTDIATDKVIVIAATTGIRGETVGEATTAGLTKTDIVPATVTAIGIATMTAIVIETVIVIGTVTAIMIATATGVVRGTAVEAMVATEARRIATGTPKVCAMVSMMPTRENPTSRPTATLTKKARTAITAATAARMTTNANSVMDIAKVISADTMDGS